MKECPKCDLINTDTVQRCDCGYDFALGTTISTKLRIKKALRVLIKGIAGIAGAAWIIAPVTHYGGLVAFVISSFVLLACFGLLGLLEGD